MCKADYLDGHSETIKECYPLARKQHKCKECGRTIEKGERYFYEFYYWDGETHTHKTCEHCMVARDLIMDKCGGYVYSEILEDLWEHLYTPWGMKAARLAVGMQRKWKKFKSDELMTVPKG